MVFKTRCSSRFQFNISSNGEIETTQFFVMKTDRPFGQHPYSKSKTRRNLPLMGIWCMYLMYNLYLNSCTFFTALGHCSFSYLGLSLTTVCIPLRETDHPLIHFVPFLQSASHSCSTICLSAYCWKELWLNITMLNSTCLFTGNVSFLSPLTSGYHPSSPYCFCL